MAMETRPEHKVMKRLFSIKEAAVYLGRSPWTMAEMVRTGKLSYISDGKRKFIDIEDLETWIMRNKITPEKQENFNG